MSQQDQVVKFVIDLVQSDRSQQEIESSVKRLFDGIFAIAAEKGDKYSSRVAEKIKTTLNQIKEGIETDIIDEESVKRANKNINLLIETIKSVIESSKDLKSVDLSSFKTRLSEALNVDESKGNADAIIKLTGDLKKSVMSALSEMKAASAAGNKLFDFQVSDIKLAIAELERLSGLLESIPEGSDKIESSISATARTIAKAKNEIQQIEKAGVISPESIFVSLDAYRKKLEESIEVAKSAGPQIESSFKGVTSISVDSLFPPEESIRLKIQEIKTIFDSAKFKLIDVDELSQELSQVERQINAAFLGIGKIAATSFRKGLDESLYAVKEEDILKYFDPRKGGAYTIKVPAKLVLDDGSVKELTRKGTSKEDAEAFVRQQGLIEQVSGEFRKLDDIIKKISSSVLETKSALDQLADVSHFEKELKVLEQIKNTIIQIGEEAKTAGILILLKGPIEHFEKEAESLSQIRTEIKQIGDESSKVGAKIEGESAKFQELLISILRLASEVTFDFEGLQKLNLGSALPGLKEELKEIIDQIKSGEQITDKFFDSIQSAVEKFRAAKSISQVFAIDDSDVQLIKEQLAKVVEYKDKILAEGGESEIKKTYDKSFEYFKENAAKRIKIDEDNLDKQIKFFEKLMGKQIDAAEDENRKRLQLAKSGFAEYVELYALRVARERALDDALFQYKEKLREQEDAKTQQLPPSIRPPQRSDTVVTPKKDELSVISEKISLLEKLGQIVNEVFSSEERLSSQVIEHLTKEHEILSRFPELLREIAREALIAAEAMKKKGPTDLFIQEEKLLKGIRDRVSEITAEASNAAKTFDLVGRKIFETESKSKGFSSIKGIGPETQRFLAEQSKTYLSLEREVFSNRTKIIEAELAKVELLLQESEVEYKKHLEDEYQELLKIEEAKFEARSEHIQRWKEFELQKTTSLRRQNRIEEEATAKQLLLNEELASKKEALNAGRKQAEEGLTKVMQDQRNEILRIKELLDSSEEPAGFLVNQDEVLKRIKDRASEVESEISEVAKAFDLVAKKISETENKSKGFAGLKGFGPETKRFLDEREAESLSFEERLFSNRTSLIESELKKVESLLDQSAAEYKKYLDEEFQKLVEAEEAKFATKRDYLEKWKETEIRKTPSNKKRIETEAADRLTELQGDLQGKKAAITEAKIKAEEDLNKVLEKQKGEILKIKELVESSQSKRALFIDRKAVEDSIITLKKVWGEFQSGQASVSQLAGAITGLINNGLGPIGKIAIASAAGISYLSGQTREATERTAELAKTQFQLQTFSGASGEALRIFTVGTERAGDMTFMLDQQLQSLSGALKSASIDAEGKAATALNYFGVEAVDKTTGKVKDMDKALEELAESFGRTPDGPAKAASQFEIFGFFGARSVSYVLANWKELRKEVAESETVFKQGVGPIADLIKSQFSLQLAQQSASAAMAKQFAPQLIEYNNLLREAYKILTEIAKDETAKTFFSSLGIGMKATATAVKSLIASMEGVLFAIKYLTETKTGIIALLASIGLLSPAFLSIGRSAAIMATESVSAISAISFAVKKLVADYIALAAAAKAAEVAQSGGAIQQPSVGGNAAAGVASFVSSGKEKLADIVSASKSAGASILSFLKNPFVIAGAVAISSGLIIKGMLDELSKELNKEADAWNKISGEINKNFILNEELAKRGLISEKERIENIQILSGVRATAQNSVIKTELRLQELKKKADEEERISLLNKIATIKALRAEYEILEDQRKTAIEEIDSSANKGKFGADTDAETKKLEEIERLNDEFDKKKIASLEKQLEAQKEVASREIAAFKESKEYTSAIAEDAARLLAETEGKSSEKIIEIQKNLEKARNEAARRGVQDRIKIEAAYYKEIEEMRKVNEARFEQSAQKEEIILKRKLEQGLITEEEYAKRRAEIQRQQSDIQIAGQRGQIDEFEGEGELKRASQRIKDLQKLIKEAKEDQVKASDAGKVVKESYDEIIKTYEKEYRELEAIFARHKARVEALEENSNGKNLEQFRVFLRLKVKEIEDQQSRIDTTTKEGQERYRKLEEEKVRINEAMASKNEEALRREARIQKEYEQARLQGAKATAEQIVEAKKKEVDLRIKKEIEADKLEEERRKARLADKTREIQIQSEINNLRESENKIALAAGARQGAGEIEQLRKAQIYEREALENKIKQVRAERDLARERNANGPEAIKLQASLNDLIAQEIALRGKQAVEMADKQKSIIDASIERQKALNDLEVERLKMAGRTAEAAQKEAEYSIQIIEASIASTKERLNAEILSNGYTEKAIQLETELLNLERERLGIIGKINESKQQALTAQGSIGGWSIGSSVEEMTAALEKIRGLATGIMSSSLRGFFDLGAAYMASSVYTKQAEDLQNRINKVVNEEKRKAREEELEKERDQAEKIVQIAKDMYRAIEQAQESLAEGRLGIQIANEKAIKDNAERIEEITEQYYDDLEQLNDEYIKDQEAKRRAAQRQEILDAIDLSNQLATIKFEAAKKAFDFAISQAKAEADLRKRDKDNIQSLAEAEKGYRDTLAKRQETLEAIAEAQARGDRNEVQRLQSSLEQDTEALNANLEQIEALKKERENLAKERQAAGEKRQVEVKRQEAIAQVYKEGGTKEEIDAKIKHINDMFDLEQSYIAEKLEAQKSGDEEYLKQVEDAFAKQKEAMAEAQAAEMESIKKQREEKERQRKEDEALEAEDWENRKKDIEERYAESLALQEEAHLKQLAQIKRQQAEVYVSYLQNLLSIEEATIEKLDEIGVPYDEFFKNIVDGFKNTGDQAKDVAAAIALVMAQLAGKKFEKPEDVKKFLADFKSSSNSDDGKGGAGGGSGIGGKKEDEDKSKPKVKMPPIAWEILRRFASGEYKEETAVKALRDNLSKEQLELAMKELAKLKQMVKQGDTSKLPPPDADSDKDSKSTRRGSGNADSGTKSQTKDTSPSRLFDTGSVGTLGTGLSSSGEIGRILEEIRRNVASIAASISGNGSAQKGTITGTDGWGGGGLGGVAIKKQGDIEIVKKQEEKEKEIREMAGPEKLGEIPGQSELIKVASGKGKSGSDKGETVKQKSLDKEKPKTDISKIKDGIFAVIENTSGVSLENANDASKWYAVSSSAGAVGDYLYGLAEAGKIDEDQFNEAISWYKNMLKGAEDLYVKTVISDPSSKDEEAKLRANFMGGALAQLSGQSFEIGPEGSRTLGEARKNPFASSGKKLSESGSKTPDEKKDEKSKQEKEKVEAERKKAELEKKQLELEFVEKTVKGEGSIDWRVSVLYDAYDKNRISRQSLDKGLAMLMDIANSNSQSLSESQLSVSGDQIIQDQAKPQGELPLPADGLGVATIGSQQFSTAPTLTAGGPSEIIKTVKNNSLDIGRIREGLSDGDASVDKTSELISALSDAVAKKADKVATEKLVKVVSGVEQLTGGEVQLM